MSTDSYTEELYSMTLMGWKLYNITILPYIANANIETKVSYRSDLVWCSPELDRLHQMWLTTDFDDMLFEEFLGKILTKEGSTQ